MKIGQKLKMVRLSLGMNRKEFVKGVIDNSYLASVENGESDIRVTSLINILQKNNISVENFFEDFDSKYPLTSFYQEKVSTAFYNHDINDLQKIIENPECYSLVVKNIAKLLIADLEGKIDDLPIDMKASIKHSLFQTKKKTKDYLWILANSMQIYKFKDLEGLVNAVFNGFHEAVDEYDDQTIKLLADVALNYLKICSKNDHADQEKKKVIDYLNYLPNRSCIVAEKLEGKRLIAIQESDYQKAKKIFNLIKMENK